MVVSLMIITKVDKGLPDALLLLVDVDDVLVGGVGLRERIKLVHLLDVPDNKCDKAFCTCSQRVKKSIIRLFTITQGG